MSHPTTFKVVLVGDSSVGKSCLLLRFADDAFTESYIATIGVDFRFRTLTVNDDLVRLQIWDTAGQERFRTITSSYYRGADAILIVYDSTNRESFAHVDDWIAEVRQYSEASTVNVIVGNKSDKKASKVVSTEELLRKGEQVNLPVIETSAKEALNVEEAFRITTKKIIESQPQRRSTSNNQITSKKLEAGPVSTSANGCCGGN